MHAPQKSFVNAGAGAGAVVAVHDRLVTLTCARQQTTTPNTHITLLQFTGAVCMQCVFLQSSLGSQIGIFLVLSYAMVLHKQKLYWALGIKKHDKCN